MFSFLLFSLWQELLCWRKRERHLNSISWKKWIVHQETQKKLCLKIAWRIIEMRHRSDRSTKKSLRNVSFLSSITELYWGLFCLFVSCTTFSFGPFIHFCIWSFWFALILNSCILECWTGFTHLLNKNREVSFFLVLKFDLTGLSVTAIVVALHGS